MEPERRRSIYRARALAAWSERRDRAVLPRFAAPRRFLVLWLLVGLLMAAGSAVLVPLVRALGGLG